MYNNIGSYYYHYYYYMGTDLLLPLPSSPYPLPSTEGGGVDKCPCTTIMYVIIILL